MLPTDLRWQSAELATMGFKLSHTGVQKAVRREERSHGGETHHLHAA
jgi:hypothetical protein